MPYTFKLAIDWRTQALLKNSRIDQSVLSDLILRGDAVRYQRGMFLKVIKQEIDAVCHGPIAGKPAPTATPLHSNQRRTCGSRLAGDRAGTGNEKGRPPLGAGLFTYNYRTITDQQSTRCSW